jgi:bifunctional non-homologous end joining protein LigD
LKAETDHSPFVGKGAPRRSPPPARPPTGSRRPSSPRSNTAAIPTGSLRQAAFKGLREDKTAPEVDALPQAPSKPSKEKGRVSAQPQIAKTGEPATQAEAGRRRGHHLQSRQDPVARRRRQGRDDQGRARPLLRDGGRTHVAPRRRPPVSIIRTPEGINGETFFQRHAMPGSNPRLKLIDVKERKPYVGVVDVGGLVAIGQSGGLELHPWGCKPNDPETPDQITFDLDPDEGLDFADVIAAAKT